MPTVRDRIASAAPMSARFRRLAAAARRFRADRQGVAALEFALVLPILLMFYLSAFEGSRGFEASSKANSAAETAGNLVTRLSSVSKTEMSNILTLASAIMSPFPGEVKIVVTAVRIDDKGVATVAWSKWGTRTGDDPVAVQDGVAAGTPYTLPADLASQKSTFFVEAKATYPFKLLANYANLIKSQDLVRTKIFRPRVGDEITWVS